MSTEEELGNFDPMEYLIRSVYRFMAKMESFKLSAKSIKPELEKLLLKLKQHENNRLETRAFLYLDVISWLESKISNVAVQDIIRGEFLTSVKG